MMLKAFCHVIQAFLDKVNYGYIFEFLKIRVINNLGADMLKKSYDNSLLLNEILESMGTIIEFDLEDYETHQHAVRVAEGAVFVAEKMGLDADTIQKLYFAALLHDIGKITVSADLLHKRERLTDDEYSQVKNHTVTGSRIIASLPGMTSLASWVRWHHEWWDGSGYPDGLKEAEIPLPVQILSILDMFDSIQTPRADRDPRQKEEAVRIITEQRGTHFNPELVDIVLELIHDSHVSISEKPHRDFAALKKKYVDVPFHDSDKNFWQSSNIESLYYILKLFADVIDSKNEYTRGHSTRVSVLAKILCEKMGMPHEDLLKVEIAGLLHDAGKVTIPIEILNKQDSLTEEEWAIVRAHTTKTFEIIGYSAALREIAFIAACHHERYDGNGYPMKLAKDEIPFLSHVIAVADTYDAVTSARAYHPQRSAEYAYNIIREVSGRQLHPDVVETLLAIPPKHIEGIVDMHISSYAPVQIS